ncbi:MAG: CpsD/CapB family tyrosine-protein kinase [Acidobacteria bacterium]|nr:CpsD/CapB family tyrosine-protein kinase [Acidobacteriota bacterium]
MGIGREHNRDRASRVVRLETPSGPAAAAQGTIDGRFVSLLDPGCLEAEPYRALRHTLEQRHGGTRLIAVTSAVAGEGKTTTAVNLAGALAQDAEARILLVDANLRKPSIARALGLGSVPPGLVESVSSPGSEPLAFVRRSAPFRLSILTAGQTPEHPYEVLRSPRLGEILQAARERYDTVVVDASPVLPVPDHRALAAWVDSFLLVVAAGRTPRRLIEEALESLDPSRVIGIVFNEDDRPSPASYAHYYGTRSGGGQRSDGGSGSAGWQEASA